MSRRSVGLLITLLSVTGTSALSAQQPPEAPPALAPSSFATEEVHINSWPIAGRWFDADAGYSGPARIAISYGQPHARGRQVEGGLIPRDTVWRLGANPATTLHTDVDMTLGSVHVPHGDYTLYLLDSNNGWQLIINRQTANWGTDYDPSRDVGRTMLTRRQLPEPQESLAIYLVPEWAAGRGPATSLQGTLSIVWGTSALSTNWVVDKTQPRSGRSG
jgi:hypothetical protein